MPAGKRRAAGLKPETEASRGRRFPTLKGRRARGKKLCLLASSSQTRLFRECFFKLLLLLFSFSLSNTPGHHFLPLPTPPPPALREAQRGFPPNRPPRGGPYEPRGRNNDGAVRGNQLRGRPLARPRQPRPMMAALPAGAGGKQSGTR